MAKNFTYTGAEDLFIGNFIEISIDPVLLNNFSNEDGMSSYLSSNSEEFQKLKTELLKEVIYVIDTHLTDKQKEVIKMTYLEGKTQDEISSELGKHQTTVHKILCGNIDYNNKRKRYGGAIKKIRKLCSSSKKIQSILKQMKEVCADKQL